MSNQERAAEVILKAEYEHRGHTCDLYTDTHVYAKALDDAGLLMPDLPEPDESHHDPKWQADYRESWEDEFGEDLTVPSLWEKVGENVALQVFPGHNEVQPYYDGEPEEPVSVDEARQIGMKWLAAAKLAEEQK